MKINNSINILLQHTDGSGANSGSAAAEEESTSLEQPLHKQQQHQHKQHKPKTPLRGASAHAEGQQNKKKHQD